MRGGLPRRSSSKVITRRWRLSMFDGAEWGELYDLDKDPGEFMNLWDDRAHFAQRAVLIEALARQEIAAVDRVPMPTGHA